MSKACRFACCLLLAFAVSAATHADDAPVELDVARIEGQMATVELASGVIYDSVQVSRVAVHSQSGEPQRLIGVTDNGRRRTFKFDAIARITVGSEAVYQAAAKPPSGNSIAADDPRLTKAERLAREQAEQHQQWLARLEARGIKPWPPLTEAEHTTAIEEHKKRLDEVAKLLPGFRVYETEHFLFGSNIPPQQVGVFITSLDRMYAWMQQTYGVAEGTSVWRGKASVFAFVTKEQFAAFERQFMKNDPGGAMGLCHTDSRRNVCIAVHQGTSADYFGTVLVHETSHGFIHCYQTPVRVPSWVNEGMAEVIAAKMVPSSQGVQRKEEVFLETIRTQQQPRLGAAFFATDEKIPFELYGGATTMTRFLIQTDQQEYVRFINLLKEGMDWQQAMQASYNASQQQLVAAYGAWIGVPNLLP